MKIKLKFPPEDKIPHSIGRNSSGIALFMVLSAISVLAILITEFTYIAQTSQAIAFGGLDQAKAHYLAKSGFKLSLLRLKAYMQVKALVKSLGGASQAAASMIPQGAIEQIWQFPFIYPIPTEMLGADPTTKKAIDDFQKASSLEGSFTAKIDSESNKYNLNSILQSYSSSPPSNGNTSQQQNQNNSNFGNPNIGANGSQQPAAAQPFNPDDARQNLYTFLNNIYTLKSQADPDFASLHSDFRLVDLSDQIASWADRTYDRRSSSSKDAVPVKRAPFYSITELHMLPSMEEDLYDLFAKDLTVSMTTGINVNTMSESMLRNIAPSMTQDDVTSFMKFRDSTEVDNKFKSSDDFYTYLGAQVGAYRNPASITALKEDNLKNNLILIVDETQFKITVRAEVNQATKTIEAWVSINSPSDKSGGAGSNQANVPPVQVPPPPLDPNNPQPATPKDAGIKVTYMRIF